MRGFIEGDALAANASENGGSGSCCRCGNKARRAQERRMRAHGMRRKKWREATGRTGERRAAGKAVGGQQPWWHLGERKEGPGVNGREEADGLDRAEGKERKGERGRGEEGTTPHGGAVRSGPSTCWLGRGLGNLNYFYFQKPN